MSALEFQLTAFSDPQGEAAARVYVVAVPTRDATNDELAAYRLSGQIVGPTCRYSSTLQSKIPFHHRGFTQCGRRTALVAEAVVPDPCYWSPELPFLYRAVGEVSGDVTGAQAFDQMFGIRSIGTSRNRLTLNGKVWVPRGVAQKSVVAASFEDWRREATMMIVEVPTPQLCREASEAGVLIAAFMASPAGTEAETWLRVGSYPSLTLAACVAEPHDRRELETAARGVLFGHSTASTISGFGGEGVRFHLCPLLDDASSDDDSIAAEIDVAAKRLTDRITETGPPVLALRNGNGRRPLAELRAECDRYQSELAARRIDVAGYMIG